MAPGYRASKNPDGTWNIHDVPIFASNKLRKVEVTRDWQEKAVRKAQERFRAVGHIPPLHENHTGGSAKVRNLGFVVPNRVGTLKTVEEDEAGNLVTRDAAATYADFQRIPDADYQRIKRGELPYVSVEAGLADHELHSAALLPNAPAIKTPPIAIASEEDATLVAAYSAEGGTVRTTMRFAAAMDESKQPKMDGSPSDAALAPEAPAPKAPEAPKAEEKPEGEKPAAEAPAAPEAPKIDVAALFGQVAMLQSQVAALVAAAQKAPQPQQPAQPAGATAPSPMPYAASVTVTDAATGNTLKPDSTGVVTLGTWSAPTSGSTFGVTSGGIPGQPMHPVVSPEQFGALVATVDALKADAAAAKVASDRDAKVRTLVAGLAAEGFAVPADAEATLVKMAADQGMAAVDAYAAAWRKHGRKAPPSSIEGAIEAPHHPELTKAFEKYGPAVEPHVARFSAAFDELKGASRLDRETFVLRNLQSLRLIKE